MGKMNFMRKPNKRMRLDLESNFEGNVANDDLWGQEDITADEFDMLEFQATQTMPTTSVNNVVPLEVRMEYLMKSSVLPIFSHFTLLKLKTKNFIF